MPSDYKQSYTQEEINSLQGIFDMFKDEETDSLKVSSLGEVLQKIGRYDGDDLNEMIAELQGGEDGPAPDAITFDEFMSLLHRELLYFHSLYANVRAIAPSSELTLVSSPTLLCMQAETRLLERAPRSPTKR